MTNKNWEIEWDTDSFNIYDAESHKTIGLAYTEEDARLLKAAPKLLEELKSEMNFLLSIISRTEGRVHKEMAYRVQELSDIAKDIKGKR